MPTAALPKNTTKKRMNGLSISTVKTRSTKFHNKLTLKEIHFIKAYAELGEFAQASRIAYPDLKDATDNGWKVASRPHIKPFIDQIKQRVLEEADEPYIVSRYKEKIEKYRNRDLESEELSLRALNGLAGFRKKNEVSAPAQILINIDGAILGARERQIQQSN